MQTIYGILETLLPFSWVSYDFMKNALLAVLIIAPLFGMLGTMVVNNHMSFFSDALGHSALTGIGLGMVFGIADSSLALALFGIVFALLLGWLVRKSAGAGNDTMISVFSSLSTAIGLAILSRGGQFSEYSALLVGDILAVSPVEILRLLLLLVAAFVFWCICFNALQTISINRSLAGSRGVPTGFYENLFAALLAVIVMLSIRYVGILIINALLTLPVAASRNLASNEREYHLFSVMISLFSGVLGLILSFYLDMAAGPVMIVIAAILFFLTLAVRKSVKG